jgi:hypothetical protein
MKENIIKNINSKGRNNDMIDIFEEVFGENNLEKTELDEKAVNRWRKLKNSTIRWTKSEQEDLRYHIDIGLRKEIKAAAGIPIKRKVEIIIDIMDYKLRHEVIEAKNRGEQIQNQEEIIEKIQIIDFENNGKVVKSFSGTSLYTVVLIPEKHKSSLAGVSGKDVIEIQKQIYEIQKKLAKEGISKYFLHEGFVFVEKSYELPRLAKYIKKAEDSPSLFYEDQLEKNGGEEINNFGAENVDVWRAGKLPAKWYNCAMKLNRITKYMDFKELDREEYIKKINSLNFKEDGFIEKIKELTKDDLVISREKNDEIIKYFEDEFVEKVINNTNFSVEKNVETLHNNTLANVFVLKMGALHILESDELETQQTIPEILEEKGISYITIKPTLLDF